MGWINKTSRLSKIPIEIICINEFGERNLADKIYRNGIKMVFDKQQFATLIQHKVIK